MMLASLMYDFRWERDPRLRSRHSRSATNCGKQNSKTRFTNLKAGTETAAFVTYLPSIEEGMYLYCKAASTRECRSHSGPPNERTSLEGS